MGTTKKDRTKGASGPKALRIGIVQNGKIIEEQELRKREPVSVGTGPKCTFQVASDRLPKNFELFASDGKAYYLHFDEQVSGRIQLEDEQVADFRTLEARGLVVNRGGRKAVLLSDKSRGKVMIGDITVLFQFKTVSPAPKPPELPADIRGGFLQNIDAQFAGIFIVVAILQISVLTYARSLPYVEPTSIEEISEEYQRLIMPDREPTPPVRAQVADPAGKKDEPKKDEPKKAKPKKEKDKPKKASGPKDAEAAAKAKKEANRKKVAGRGLLKVLGAKREGGDGAIADVFSEGGGSSSLEDAFSGTQGVQIATEAGQSGSRGGGAGEGVGIGNLGTEGGGSVSTKGAKREAAVRGELAEQTPEVDGELDSNVIQRVLKRKRGGIKSCYERALKRDRTLAGKIIISFEIDTRGRVRNLSFGGSLRSKDMERCVARLVRRWRFPRPAGGSVFVDYPVIVTPTG